MENQQSTDYYSLIEISEPDKLYIQNQRDKCKYIQIKNSKFEDYEEYYKACTIFILAFLEEKIVTNLTINQILEKILPDQKKSDHIKRVLEILKDLFFQTKKENSHFLQIHTNFGFNSLFFIRLNKIIERFKNLKNSLRKMWTIFLYVTKLLKIDQKIELPDKIDIFSTIVIKELCILLKKENYNNFVNELKDFIGYTLEKSDFEKYSKIIKTQIPNFDNPFDFDDNSCSFYEKKYITLLSKYELNFLIFLKKKKNMNSITLTPLLKNSSQCISSKNQKKKNNFKTKLLHNVSLVSEFKQVVSVLRSPETQLHSPNLKRQLQIEDKLEEFSKIYQWYKEMTQNVKLKKMVIKGVTYKVSEECCNYLEDNSIRNNYISVLKIMDGLNLDGKEGVLKLFFKLLSQFMMIEMKNNKFDFDKVKSLFRDSVFMKSLFAISLEFDTLIRNLAIFKFEDIVLICETSFYDFWKILFNFAKNFAKGLPKLIKRRIVELEYMTLLKYIWQPLKEKKNELFINEEDSKKKINEAEKILNCKDIQSKHIIKRLLNILAERVYLITNEIEISDDLKENIWKILKSFIFENKLTSEENLEINFHLDWIIILSIYHIIYFNKIYVKLNQIIEIYKKKNLFTINLIREDLMSYYNKIFKKNIKKDIRNINIIIPPRKNTTRENPNTTPVHTFKKKYDKIKDSPLFENLNSNLARREIKNFASGIFAKSRKNSYEVGKINSIDLSNVERKESDLFNISHSFADQSILNNKIVSPLPGICFGNREVLKNGEEKGVDGEAGKDDGGANTPCFG